MKNVTRKFLSLSLSLLIAGGCTQGINDVAPDRVPEAGNQLAVTNKPGEPLADYKLPTLRTNRGRLVFKDRNEFHLVSAKIGRSDASVGESWEKSQNGFVSYLTQVRNTKTWDSLANLPTYRARLLNAHGEYQLGDTIVWYHNDALYYIPSGSEAELASLQERGGDPARAYPIIQNKRVLSSGRSEGAEWVDEKYSYPYNTSSHTLKISFELISQVWKYPSGLNISEIYTKIRLVYWQPGSWPTPGRWRQAGENRTSSITSGTFNVSTLSAFGPYFNFGPMGATLTADYDLDGFLGSTPINGDSDYWAATVNGNYSCQVLNPGHSAGFYNVNPASFIWQ